MSAVCCLLYDPVTEVTGVQGVYARRLRSGPSGLIGPDRRARANTPHPRDRHHRARPAPPHDHDRRRRHRHRHRHRHRTD